MKIPNEYPKFINKSALLIVLGREDGTLYLASNGFIDKITEFGVRIPKYSDREGFFLRSGGGRLLGTGSVYEPKIKMVERRFLNDFSEKIKKILKENKVTEIYLFSPKFMHTYFEQEIPPKYLKMVRCKFNGNYRKNHPLELLDKIRIQISKSHPGPVPVNKEARKILSKFKIINKRKG